MNLTPTLTPLNMELSIKHEHPDIKMKQEYLCLIDNRFYCGTFSRVWYGLVFNGWIASIPYQFDAPGWNSSKWQQIWRMDRNYG